VSDVFSRIVCGVDGSEAGREAVAQARRLATDASRLVLVSVGESHLAVHAGALASKVKAEIEADAQAALDEVAGAGDEARLVHGHAADTFVRIAAEEDATLVAVGSHGHRRGPGIVLGSVATRVAHDAPCSVLIARTPADPEPDRFPRSIVVGVDGSPSSLTAAAVAQELGARVGAGVALVAATKASDFDEDGLSSSGLSFERRDSEPVAALVEASRSVDLLVVASRGLHGVRALGSVSERVAHRAHCSLLVVRSPGP
jgi:nucleotide-binding universal stress UspA family protein